MLSAVSNTVSVNALVVSVAEPINTVGHDHWCEEGPSGQSGQLEVRIVVSGMDIVREN